MDLVDEDTKAFNSILAAFALPNNTAEEKQSRNHQIHEATLNAIKVPFCTIKTSMEALDLLEAMIESGNPNSISDAGVGVLAIRSCIFGAHLNVLINMAGINSNAEIENIKNDADVLMDKALKMESLLLDKVRNRILKAL
jgi:glutamate formiminotransferase/formiminotetrahydrofolate cyclodeaminase